jgi:hypothetical protein
MSYDLFLDWLSERGSGRWYSFVAAHDWLFNAGRRQAERIAPGWTARTLSDLGHLEVDWQGQRWSVTPPLLTVLPTAGARSLLTGGRTRMLMRSLEEETSEAVTDNVIYARHRQDAAPDAIFLVSRDEAEVEQLAHRLGIRYEYSAADTLSRVLPSLAGYLAVSGSTPAPTGYEARRFDPAALRWSPTSSDLAPGLFMYEVHGISRYRFVSELRVSHEVERAIGTYAELQRTGRQVLGWRANDVNGTLTVPAQAPLPALHARVATACSGLAARFSKVDASNRYVNVPSEIAERIATSLGQELQELEAREALRQHA